MVERHGSRPACPPIGKGQTTASVTLKKGTYNFYCSVAGHEDAGMKGKLIVS